MTLYLKLISEVFPAVINYNFTWISFSPVPAAATLNDMNFDTPPPMATYKSWAPFNVFKVLVITISSGPHRPLYGWLSFQP